MYLPDNIIPIAESVPIYGMNSYDDPKDLKPGECVLLVNACPGRPPEPRRGCEHWRIENTSGYDYASEAVHFRTAGGNDYVIVWVKSSTTYYLVKIHVDTRVMTILGTATGFFSPNFYLLNMLDKVYSFQNEECSSWNGAGYAKRNKVIELKDTTADVIREMMITAEASVQTVSLASGGVHSAATDNWVEYSFTYVRREDAAAFDTNGAAIKISTRTPGTSEGPESGANRKTLQIVGSSQKIMIDILNNATERATALAQGATHMRIWRTRRRNTEILAQGATKYFVSDFPLIATESFEDDVTDNALASETMTLAMSTYTYPPLAALAEFAGNRLYLFGLLDVDKARAYYSEYPAGDTNTPKDESAANPVKFASMFSDSYYIDFSIKKAKYATGTKRLRDDLYFFFDEEIWALYGTDPEVNDLASLVSDQFGLAFPATLTKCDIQLPEFGGECFLFLSNRGPACLKSGGEVFLMTDFKIAELWPDKSDELYADLTDHRDWIITHCDAEFFDNQYIVTYETYAGVKKTWCYFLNPELRSNSEAPRGPWQVELAAI